MPEGTTPPLGTGPTLAAPWVRVGTSEPVSDPASSCPLPFAVKLFAIYSPGSPEVCISCFRRVLFRAVFCQELFSDLERHGLLQRQREQGGRGGHHGPEDRGGGQERNR